jgi:F0F1-type ATP synthase membrane subunit c/vacuolar-type H+-ATPase subunit K
MAFPSDRSGVARVLRMALLLSVLVYALLASLVLGPPKWRAPWIPSDQDKAILLVVLGIMALGEFVAGWLVGSLRRPPRFMAATADPAAFGLVRFIIGLALIESGAIFGLVLSFLTRDARYAIVFAAPAVLLMIWVPGVEPPGTDDRQW